MNTKISALITTYNESQFLTECLSRLDFCDEIVVVDLGSSDNCVEIAQSFGAKILHHELVPFAEHVRNFAIENARNEWVLFSDPDMYFPEGIGEKIDEFISNCPDNIGVIHMPARKYFKNQPILYGSKGALESRPALINTKKVDFLPLVHYSGIRPKSDIIAVGLMVNESEYIQHYWVNSIDEAVEKARRYLPFEPEQKHNTYKRLKIKPIIKDLFRTVMKDVKSGAFKSRISFQIMIFNLWYWFQVSIRWMFFELKKSLMSGRNKKTD